LIDERKENKKIKSRKAGTPAHLVTRHDHRREAAALPAAAEVLHATSTATKLIARLVSFAWWFAPASNYSGGVPPSPRHGALVIPALRGTWQQSGKKKNGTFMVIKY
jgi:hypothetical protein